MASSSSADNHKLASNTIILIFGKAVGTISMIVLFIILSRLFSESEYGSVRQALMINKGLLEVFALGIPMSIYYFLSRLRDSRKKIFITQSLVMLGVLGLLCSFIVFMTAGLISEKFDNPELEGLLRIFSLYPFFVLPTLALESVLVTLGYTKRYALFLIIDKAILLLLATLAAVVFRSIEGFLAVLLIFSFVELIAATLLVKYSVSGLPPQENVTNLKDQLSVALPTGVANIVGILNVELDKLIVSLFFSVEKFARYVNGAFEIPFIGTVANATTSVLMPEYVRSYEEKNTQRMLDLWHGAIIKVAIIFIPLILFLLFNAGDFITLLFSDKYVGSVIIFQIYLIAQLPKLTWYGPLLVAMGYSKEPLIASLLSLVCNLILNIYLIKLIGFSGPAVATVLTTYILVCYFLLRIKMVMGVGWISLYPWYKLSLILVLSSVFGLAISYSLDQFELPRITSLIIGFCLYMALLLPAFRSINIISSDDVDFVMKNLAKLMVIIKR